MHELQSEEQRWSRELLAPYLGSLFEGRPLVIVSNREPWIHCLADDGGSLRAERPASGLVSALEPLAEAVGGTWIAHGAGTGDRIAVDGCDAVALPPGSPSYRLRRLWLSEAQIDGYYRQISNRGLWPLCHQAFVVPQFDPANWHTYRQVNELFARTILEEAPEDGALVFLQDYHLALVPRLIKQARPGLTVAQFWHVPWPHIGQLRTCPYAVELIEGLLGNDLLGFQSVDHCRHFLEAADQLPAQAAAENEAAASAQGALPTGNGHGRDAGLPSGHVTRIGSFPISIDFAAWDVMAEQPPVREASLAWRRELDLDGQRLGIGIDRLDYTKGLLQRVVGLDHLFETQPQWRGRLRFVQLLAPQRDGIDTYRDLRRELEQRVARLNDRWRQGRWFPFLLLQQQRRPSDLPALHRLAVFCLVSSLDDGMNLVAKEFVASRSDGDGVLILSRYTGSARELDAALQINPYAPQELAAAMHQALTMPEPLRRRRMARMRRQVREHNVYHWAAKLLTAAAQSRGPQAPALSLVADGS